MAKKKMQIPDGLAGLVRAAQEESSVNFDQTTEILTENKAPREPEQKENDKLVVETKKTSEIEKKEEIKDPLKDIPENSLLFEGSEESWNLFHDYLAIYKKDTSKGKEIWINEDIRYELDKIKTASRSTMKLKTMVNAMLHTFLIEHKNQIKKLLDNA